MPKLDPTIRDWLYAREMLRRLGFTPEEIFFDVYPSGRVLDSFTGQMVDLGATALAVTIRRGDVQFVWIIGPTSVPPRDLQAAYEIACAAWNAGEGPFDLAAFRSSAPMQKSVPLLMALKSAGLTFRKDAPC